MKKYICNFIPLSGIKLLFLSDKLVPAAMKKQIEGCVEKHCQDEDSNIICPDCCQRIEKHYLYFLSLKNNGGIHGK